MPAAAPDATEMRPVILLNGECSDRISILDRGFAYGDGVFRTLRARSGKFSWSRQYRKLVDDCRRIGIVACPAEHILRQEVASVVEDLPDCIVKIVVTRGEAGRGYAISGGSQPTRVVARFPVPARMPTAGSGVRVRWCQLRLATQPALAGVKHLNRLENVLARSEWTDEDFAEGLMLDQAGFVIEGTMSNLFIVECGRLLTPGLDGAGVAGVQRERLMEAAPLLGIDCQVESLTPERVMAADQVYLTNSVIGLWWVSSLGERHWSHSALTPRLVDFLLHVDD